MEEVIVDYEEWKKEKMENKFEKEELKMHFLSMNISNDVT